MSKFFAQFNVVTGFIFSVVQSDVDMVAADIIEVSGTDALGKVWNGSEIVEAPKVSRYKVWDKPQFIFMLGKTVLAAINGGANDDLAFYKYILENSPHVDLNVKEFRDMVTALHVAGLIDEEILAALLVKE